MRSARMWPLRGMRGDFVPAAGADGRTCRGAGVVVVRAAGEKAGPLGVYRPLSSRPAAVAGKALWEAPLPPWWRRQPPHAGRGAARRYTAPDVADRHRSVGPPAGSVRSRPGTKDARWPAGPTSKPHSASSVLLRTPQPMAARHQRTDQRAAWRQKEPRPQPAANQRTTSTGCPAAPQLAISRRSLSRIVRVVPHGSIRRGRLAPLPAQARHRTWWRALGHRLAARGGCRSGQGRF